MTTQTASDCKNQLVTTNVDAVVKLRETSWTNGIKKMDRVWDEIAAGLKRALFQLSLGLLPVSSELNGEKRMRAEMKRLIRAEQMMEWREFTLDEHAGSRCCSGVGAGYEFALFFTAATRSVMLCKSLIPPSTAKPGPIDVTSVYYPFPMIKERDTMLTKPPNFVYLNTAYLLISKGIVDFPPNPAAIELRRFHLRQFTTPTPTPPPSSS